ncbi:uncharacterized protein G2W53_035898 [Senna tora]|uniref:Uncharacterized protein n=1 Tax=Senna tora TaxID=362788 RepID=A0A834SRG6_9FABA|nr:uncharacterized protein G2W53_035898 [Senna tora]
MYHLRPGDSNSTTSFPLDSPSLGAGKVQLLNAVPFTFNTLSYPSA